MDKNEIISLALDFTEKSPLNRIPEDKAAPGTSGLKMFEAPLLGFGDAEDGIFNRFKKSGVIGKHYLPPLEWLQGARTVIAFFVPFSRAIKESNARDVSWPSPEWLHGRIEGQEFVRALSVLIRLALVQAGFPSVSPLLDERFKDYYAPTEQNPISFTSNWSERHAAYACGLGTFGLSRGLITEKGMAGRFGSIITTLPVATDQRAYTRHDQYCTRCGLCIKQCPVQAISLEKGKEHQPCYDFQAGVMKKEKPYFGCGKCQVGVPCESARPLPAKGKK